MTVLKSTKERIKSVKRMSIKIKQWIGAVCDG